MPAKVSTLEAATHWGSPSPYTLARHTTASSRLAVLFPGQAYPVDAPLLYYAGRAAFENGCDVLGIEYGYVTNRKSLEAQDFAALVSEVFAGIGGVLAEPYSSIVFIAKSLGTAVASEVATLSPTPVDNHVFLTPVRRTIPFLQDAKRALVIVGDRDPLFGSEDVAQLAPFSNVRTHVEQGADHSLYVEGDHMKSLQVLKDATGLCAQFCAAMNGES